LLSDHPPEPSHILTSELLYRLNSREVFRGHGINEEQTLSTQRQVGNTAFSLSGARTNSAVRFNVGEGKPVVNVAVTRTVEAEQGRNKFPFDYDAVSLFSCLMLCCVHS
jgi:hypothetical protein